MPDAAGRQTAVPVLPNLDASAQGAGRRRGAEMSRSYRVIPIPAAASNMVHCTDCAELHRLPALQAPEGAGHPEAWV